MSKFEGCTMLPRFLRRKCNPPRPLFFDGIMAGKFVISPEPFVEKCRSLGRARDLYMDVVNGQVRLAWTDLSDDGMSNKIEYIDRIEASRLNIDYDLFLDSVSEDRGAAIIEGRYPVTNEIIRCLRKGGLRP